MSATNGQAASCRRCKELKARCDRTHLLPCSRCVRLQIPCESGPPSQQGKRKRPTANGGLETCAPDLVSSTSSSTVRMDDLIEYSSCVSTGCSTDWRVLIAFLRGFCTAPQEPLSREDITSALLHGCMFATPGENPSLLGTIVSAAAWLGVPAAIRPQQILGRMETPPAPVTEYLRSRPRPSYAMARCFTLRHGVCATDAFCRDICSLERMIAWLEDHHVGSVLSVFLAAEDVSLIPEAGGRLMKRAPTTAQPSESVRVRMHMSSAAAVPGDPSGTAGACVVPCQAMVQLLTNHHFGAADTWFGMELTPLQADPTDPVDVTMSERSRPTQSAGSADPHAAAGVAEQLGLVRVDETPGEVAEHDESWEVLGCVDNVEQQLVEALKAYADMPPALD